MAVESINRDRMESRLKGIEEKVNSGERISDDDCLLLYEKADLGLLASMADRIRYGRHGHKTFFNRNFHIEPTNVCIYTCNFCSYSRLIRKREEGWEYSMEEMMEMIRAYHDKPITEVHIVGGVLPQYDLEFYTAFFRKIKEHRPELHIKALTPVEYHYIFKKAKVSYAEGMKLMKEAGLDSIPGGGAEIFHPEIRQKIAADKCNADQWLEIHEIWHGMGGRSNATILYGHIEGYEHRVDHMRRLRELQDRTGGFQTYIPLKFRNQNNDMSHVPEVTAIEDLKNYAVSRIYLDNFDHIKAYWPMIGKTTTQMSLAYGVDDIDGTIDDSTRIYSMAGAEDQNPTMTTHQLCQLIKQVGRKPIERDTLYNVVQDYSGVEFEEDREFRGYIDLPIAGK